MSLIDRRRVLGVVAAFGGLALLGHSVSAEPIKPDAAGKICEREAKAKIDDIIKRMLDGLEEISGNELSPGDRSKFMTDAWDRNRKLIMTRYTFKD